MIATIAHGPHVHKIDLANPMDISIPLVGGGKNVNAWYLDLPEIVPVHGDGFIGKVAEGGNVNFNRINFNPHSHMTHTECLGHITRELYSVNQQLNTYFFLAELITIVPERMGEDLVIPAKPLELALNKKACDALIIRTLPNSESKMSKDYSHTNPPYLQEEGVRFLVSLGVEHLLVDLPSVDKEKDGGALASHKTFWRIGKKERRQATITELIYVPNDIEDGRYWLNLQVAPFENDAAPSRPVLYKILN